LSATRWRWWRKDRRRPQWRGHPAVATRCRHQPPALGAGAETAIAVLGRPSSLAGASSQHELPRAVCRVPPSERQTCRLLWLYHLVQGAACLFPQIRVQQHEGVEFGCTSRSRRRALERMSCSRQLQSMGGDGEGSLYTVCFSCCKAPPRRVAARRVQAPPRRDGTLPGMKTLSLLHRAPPPPPTGRRAVSIPTWKCRTVTSATTTVSRHGGSETVCRAQSEAAQGVRPRPRVADTAVINTERAAAAVGSSSATRRATARAEGRQPGSAQTRTGTRVQVHPRFGHRCRPVATGP